MDFSRFFERIHLAIFSKYSIFLQVVSIQKSWKYVRANSGNKCNSNEKRSKKRDDISCSYRRKELSIESGEEEKWDKHNKLEKCSIDDASSYFLRCFKYHLECWRLFMTPFQIIFFEPTEYILHTDDRIIDKFSDSDDDTSEGHDIDSDAKLLEYYCCYEECYR